MAKNTDPVLIRWAVPDTDARPGRPAAGEGLADAHAGRRAVRDSRYPSKPMTDTAIPPEYRGWWRIVDTGTWVNDDLDILGPALLSLTGGDDRLRMHCLLAYVDARPTRTGVSFVWRGAWEYDPVSGTGSARLGKDGRLRGKLRIRDGDDSTFCAERTEEPDRPIEDPPSYRDKWRRW
jgi:hypothetical protein